MHLRGGRFFANFTKTSALHHCSYLPKPTERDLCRAGLSCQLRLFLDKDGNLVAETLYQITSNELPSLYLQNHNLLICPHRRLIIERAHSAPGPTRKLVDQVKVDGTWWKWSRHSISCSECKTTICDPKWTFQKRKTAATAPAAEPEKILNFYVKRCLGKATEKVDMVWYQQTENNMA